MSLTIYHNPRCSKSRKTLQILKDAGVATTIVDYQSEPPSAGRIVELASRLGVAVKDLLRRHEPEFRNANDLPDLDDDTALAAWLNRNPKVLERPIVVDDISGKAVIGRPPESVSRLLRR